MQRPKTIREGREKRRRRQKRREKQQCRRPRQQRWVWKEDDEEGRGEKREQ